MSNESVIIKGTKHGLIILMDGSAGQTELMEQLKQKLEKNQGFFKGARFTLHIGQADFEQEVLEEMQAYCMSQGMIYDPQIPFFNNQVAATTDASVAQESHITEPPQGFEATFVPDSPQDSPISSMSPMHQAPEVLESEQGLSPYGLTTEEQNQQALLVEHNLRSGQKVVYSGNVIVLGDVNPGAEIIAGGNIVVMGTLRGIAHAGASGDATSTIVAYNLEPTQIRISERIGRAPDQATRFLPSFPEMAKIVKEQICIEQLGSYQTRTNFKNN